MPRVEISLFGRSYPVTCEPGAEPRLEAMAGYVDGKMRQIAASLGGTVTETRLLLLAALMLADELFELKGQQPVEREAASASAAQIAAIIAQSEKLEKLAALLEQP